jgi:protein-disulfide isomerase
MKYLCLTWLLAGALSAQIDLSGLSADQKKTALELLRTESCTCHCSMTLGQCRVQDPNCSDSRGLAAIVVKAVREGKDAAQVRKLLAGSEIARRRSEPPSVLGDPVRIQTDGAPVKGPATARITLVEFSDFECPYCSLAVAKVDAVLAAYPKQTKLIYKQFPLSTHPHATLAAEASLAAHAQGKFWPMHDKLFQNSRKLSRENILAWAKELGLDMQKFTTELDTGKYKAAVAKDTDDGDKAGVEGTPTLFINGKRYNGALDLAAVKPVLDAELK